MGEALQQTLIDEQQPEQSDEQSTDKAEKDIPEKSSSEKLLFEDVGKIDKDHDYWFTLRGRSINQLIDAATPLLGMVLRISRLTELKTVETIYNQTVEELKMIEIELTEAKYEHAVIITYRYLLCTFIDEVVMSTPWGADSHWAGYSLLTRFHNETWGGEKFFTILNRLESDPVRYRELLEFIFLCLSLGFRGRYKVKKHGQEELDQVINNLHQILQRMNESNEKSLTVATQHVVHTRYRMSRQFPVWGVFAAFSGGLMVIYIIYAMLLSEKSNRVIEQLNQILQ